MINQLLIVPSFTAFFFSLSLSSLSRYDTHLLPLPPHPRFTHTYQACKKFMVAKQSLQQMLSLIYRHREGTRTGSARRSSRFKATFLTYTFWTYKELSREWEKLTWGIMPAYNVLWWSFTPCRKDGQWVKIRDTALYSKQRKRTEKKIQFPFPS